MLVWTPTLPLAEQTEILVWNSTDYYTLPPSLALTLQLSFIISFAFVQAFIRPFKSLAVELLDMFLIANLCFMLLGTIARMTIRIFS